MPLGRGSSLVGRATECPPPWCTTDIRDPTEAFHVVKAQAGRRMSSRNAYAEPDNGCVAPRIRLRSAELRKKHPKGEFG